MPTSLRLSGVGSRCRGPRRCPCGITSWIDQPLAAAVVRALALVGGGGPAPEEAGWERAGVPDEIALGHRSPDRLGQPAPGWRRAGRASRRRTGRRSGPAMRWQRALADGDHAGDAGGLQGASSSTTLGSLTLTRSRVSAADSTLLMLSWPPSPAMKSLAFSGGHRVAQFRLDARCLVDDLGDRVVAEFGLVAGDLEVLLDVGLEVLRSGTEDRLHVVADHQHAGRAERLELLLVGLADVVHADPQAGDAGVQVLDVAPAAEGEHELLGEPVRGVLARLAGRRPSSSSRPGVFMLNS